MKNLFTSLFIIGALFLTSSAVFACDCNCGAAPEQKCNCAQSCDCGCQKGEDCNCENCNSVDAKCNCKSSCDCGCKIKRHLFFRKNKCNCAK